MKVHVIFIVLCSISLSSSEFVIGRLLYFGFSVSAFLSKSQKVSTYRSSPRFVYVNMSVSGLELIRSQYSLIKL